MSLPYKRASLGIFLLFTQALNTRAQEFTVDRFSQEAEENGIPKGWTPLTFKKIERHTRYSIGKEGKNYFLIAESSSSASALIKEIRLDLRQYPILSWRWKIDKSLETADARKKSGDDYAARIYVTFQYEPSKADFWQRRKYSLAKTFYGKYPPHGALNYIWDNRLSTGTFLNNAYTDRAKMIVVESGNSRAGEWVEEKRDVYQDYLKLFGGEPPATAFLAVMTDTDNTGESARACYDDIVFLEAAGAVKKEGE